MPAALSYEEREALVAVLASWSEEAMPGNGSAYFAGLVKAANFTGGIRTKLMAGYVGDAAYNARQLISHSLTIGTNPADGNAALGSILKPLFNGSGVEDATLFACLIVKNGLWRSSAELDALRVRYQVAERGWVVAGAAPDDEVAWAPETEQLALQGWFAPEPDWLDMGLLMKAAERARSVCRVEIRGAGVGTGVLIRNDLVLTNYHVMGGGTLDENLPALEANAAGTVLRFGAFTSKAAETKGQEVGLDRQKPILACSRTYDFALLRTDGSVATDVQPFGMVGALPARRNALHMLEHPRGGPMKLALNATGVSWVDPALVTLQYTAKVAPGASGSPCFDQDWNLVALHHRGSDTKGQGILMQSVFAEIRDYLK